MQIAVRLRQLFYRVWRGVHWIPPIKSEGVSLYFLRPNLVLVSFDPAKTRTDRVAELLNSLSAADESMTFVIAGDPVKVSDVTKLPVLRDLIREVLAEDFEGMAA
jgi:hypothetical protein